MGQTTNQKCNIYYVACYDLVQEYQTAECSAEENSPQSHYERGALYSHAVLQLTKQIITIVKT